MKRFLLFRFSEFYPAGGWEDFQRDFDTLDQAIAALTALGDEQIVDLVLGKVVHGFGMSA